MEKTKDLVFVLSARLSGRKKKRGEGGGVQFRIELYSEGKEKTDYGLGLGKSGERKGACLRKINICRSITCIAT